MGPTSSRKLHYQPYSNYKGKHTTCNRIRVEISGGVRESTTVGGPVSIIFVTASWVEPHRFTMAEWTQVKCTKRVYLFHIKAGRV